MSPVSACLSFCRRTVFPPYNCSTDFVFLYENGGVFGWLESVATPQDRALIDARKAVDMVAKTNTPVIGLIENMSHYARPHCGEVAHIFGRNGARSIAQSKAIPFLGSIPLHLDIREGSDTGSPIVKTDAGGEIAKSYANIASKIIKAVTLHKGNL